MIFTRFWIRSGRVLIDLVWVVGVPDPLSEHRLLQRIVFHDDLQRGQRPGPVQGGPPDVPLVECQVPDVARRLLHSQVRSDRSSISFPAFFFEQESIDFQVYFRKILTY